MLKMGLDFRGAAVIARFEHLTGELDKTLEEMALKVEREAKRRCPVRTGRLRASIHHGKIEDYVYFVGSPVVYAPFVEFGTRRMAAKPYLRPAVRVVVNEYRTKGLFR